MKKERKCGEDALGEKRKGNGESEVRKRRRRRSGGVLQIIYEKNFGSQALNNVGKALRKSTVLHTNTQTLYF